MLFATPEPQKAELEVVARIEEIRAQVQFVLAEPKQWAGGLAPFFLGPSIDATNDVTGSDDAVLADDPSLDPASLDPTHRKEGALAGYREAMQYVLHLHDDPHFTYDEGFVRSLHFMMLAYDPGKNPGRWRPGPIGVRSKAEVLYEAPPAESVPDLMSELVARLNEKDDDSPVTFRAAMAHLNLAKIHPFSDGNGRVARALHALVMARERIIEPEFCSIEEYAGRNRSRYFESLSDVGSMTWSPQGDARPFLRFSLTAHLHQAERVLGDARRMGEVWADAEREIQKRHLPDRMAFALADAAFAGEVGLPAYRRWAGGGERGARRDLEVLVARGLLIRARGPGGRVRYKPGPAARKIRKHVWARHPPQRLHDPF